MKKKLLFFAPLFLGLTSQAATIYVKPNAGSSAWDGQTSVYTDFKAACDAATAGDEIWVAAGEYLVTATITPESYAVYGGFLGTETSIDERVKVVDGKPWEFANPSVLKLNQSGTTLTNMFNIASAKTFTLDGVTLDGNKSKDKLGRAVNIANTYAGSNVNLTHSVFRNFKSNADGGAFNVRTVGLTIAGCLITNNEGNKGGAGYFDYTTIHDCEVTYNSVPTGLTSYQGSTNGGGGGLFLANTGTGVTAYNCYIANNTASFGGGVFIRNNSKIYNSIIVNNTSAVKGSGICFEGRDNGGSVYNCIIANNTSSATDGSGVCFTSTAAGAKTHTLKNSILYNNTDNGGAVVNVGTVVTNGSATPVIANNILDKAYSLGETASVIEAAAAKLFADIAGGDFTLPVGFVGEDKGDATGLSFADDKDYAGNVRVQGMAIEIGVYELIPATQLISLTLGSGIASTNPSAITSHPTGDPLTIEITPEATFHSPYVLVNGNVVATTENGGVYSFTIPSVDGAQDISISAFAANVLPVSEDTYQRYTTDAASGHSSDYYANYKLYESRSNYAAIPVLKFIPTEAMKAAGYNKATFKLVPTADTNTGSRTYTIRQLAGTAYADKSIYELPYNNNGVEIRKGILINEAQTLSVARSTPVEIDVTDPYILFIPDSIRFTLDTDNSSITKFYSLENGNADYIPVLVFDIEQPANPRTVEVSHSTSVSNLQTIALGNNPYTIEDGSTFELNFEFDKEGYTPTSDFGAITGTRPNYLLTIDNVTSNLIVTISEQPAVYSVNAVKNAAITWVTEPETTVTHNDSYSFSFTVAAGYYLPIAHVNGQMQTLSGSSPYQITVDNVTSDLSIAVGAYPENVIPVSADTYISNKAVDENFVTASTIEAGGDISAQYTNTKGYLYFDLSEMKATLLSNYNKATLYVVYKSNNTKDFVEKLNVRSVKDEVKATGLSLLTWTNSAEVASTYSGDEIGQGAVEITTTSLVNEKDSVDLSQNVFAALESDGILWYQLAMISDEGGNKNDGHLVSIHSLENDNPDYVPVLVFENDQPTGTSLTKDGSRLVVYATEGALTIINGQIGSSLQVLDMTGRKLYEETLTSELSTVNCGLKAGVYLVKTGNETVKVVVK